MKAVALLEEMNWIAASTRNIFAAHPDTSVIARLAPVAGNPDVAYVVVPVLRTARVVRAIADGNGDVLSFCLREMNQAAHHEESADQKLPVFAVIGHAVYSGEAPWAVANRAAF